MLRTTLKSWLPVRTSRKPARRRPVLGIEYLEDRTMLSAGLPPDLVLGRTLSAYTVPDVQNNTVNVTYTVYNQQAEDVTGILLTTTLQPGVTFATASVLPNRSDQDLAWSLGTLPAFGRASVTLTMTLPNPMPLTLDSGAHAFGTLNAGMVTADTPAAMLVNRTIPADELASTPDANTTDPFVQEQAAKLRYDPQAIFDYLNTEVGYESYVGSLRGARGTLWSTAGNSLDEASLGVALMRASGIPARYAHGTLSDPLTKQLILSMFPEPLQTVGYIPAGTDVADPANDPQLLSETRDHYWLQFDSTGSGFQNADTSGLGGTTIGTTYTTTSDTFTEVADPLRHKATLHLNRELTSPAAGLLTGGSSQQISTVLDVTFNAVDLVGRPVSIGHMVNNQNLGTPVFTSITNTYSPYLIVGDDDLDATNDELIRGTDYQEVITNFPFGTKLLTGLFLEIDLSGPVGPTETFTRTLVDLIGFDVRQHGGTPNLTFDPNGPPTISPFDVWLLC